MDRGRWTEEDGLTEMNPMPFYLLLHPSANSIHSKAHVSVKNIFACIKTAYLYSQYKYSHETFSYKDDLRGGEYLINRISFKCRNDPLTRICDRSLIFAPAKTGIFEGAKHLKFRHFLIRERF